MMYNLLYGLLLCAFFHNSFIKAQLQWTARKWGLLRKTRGSIFAISCETNNDKAATVKLYWKKNRRRSWEDVMTSYNFKDQVKKVGSVFTINSLKMGNGGSYKCEAEVVNAVGTKEKIKLEKGILMIRDSKGKVLPNITPAKFDIKVERNGNIDITCKTYANTVADPSTVLTWWFKASPNDIKKKIEEKIVSWEKGTSSTSVDKTFQAVLKLVGFQEQLAGIYMCERLVDGIRTRKEIKINLKPDVAPNVLLNTSESELLPREQTTEYIECNFTGTPTPTAVWWKKNEIIKNCTISPCILKLKTLSHPKDSGKYKCVATNFMKSVEKMISVQVQVPPKVSKLSSEHFIYKRGEEIELSIFVLNANPTPTIKWEWEYPCKKDEKCANEKWRWTGVAKQVPNAFTTTRSSYMLTQKNDEDVVSYRYTVKNSAGTTIRRFNITRKDTGQVQFTMNASGKGEVVEEKPLEVVCTTDEKVYKNAKMTRNGKKVKYETNNEGGMRRLTFRTNSTSKIDAGKYKCEAQSYKESTMRERSVEVKVTALYAPRIKSTFMDKTVQQEMNNTFISCDADALPKPKFEWKMNNKTLRMLTIDNIDKCSQSTPGWYQSHPNSPKLIICHMKYHIHQGSYECKASNKKGSMKKVMRLTILSKPNLPQISDRSSILPPTITVRYDEMRVLNCSVLSNPASNITWYRTSDIDNITRVVTNMVEDRGENYVAITGKLKSGDYFCIARNELGTTREKFISVTVTAKVTKSPVEKIQLRTSVTLIYGGIHILNCSAIGNVNISWHRVNGPDNGSTLISSEIGTNALELSGTEKESSGTFLCRGSNEWGTTNSDLIRVALSNKASIPEAESWKIVVGVSVTAVLILCVSLCVCLWYRRYLKKSYAKYLEPNKNFQMDPDRSLFEQSIDLPYDIAWEFPRNRLNFLNLLGSGEFGQVWLAHAKGINNFKPRDKSNESVKRRRAIQKEKSRHCIACRCGKRTGCDLNRPMVAIKSLKSDATESEYKDLASELKILIHLGEHQNIVNLLGACTKEGKLHVLLEYCPYGNLMNFLRERRKIFDPSWKKDENDMSKEFTLTDLMAIAYQIGKGMDFLQSKRCVHRDLATRNILVGDNYVMKIADFGLARDIYKEDVYLKKTTSLVPVKWMAPEALFDKMHTSMSDVWSYGVLLWEVFTLGGSPYPSVPVEDLFKYLKAGRRMERPDYCPPSVYTLMLDCWERAPSSRPMFLQITQRLRYILDQNFTGGSTYVNLTFGTDTTTHRLSHVVSAAPSTPRKDRTNTQTLSTFNKSDFEEWYMEKYIYQQRDKPNQQGTSKEPLLYTNVPTNNVTTPTAPPTNNYVMMMASDHYQNPSTSAYQIPSQADKDGTYV